MKTIELTPKALEDLEAIWLYSYERFGVLKADEYVGRFSTLFEVLASHQVGTARPELGEGISALPAEQHVIYFVATASVVTVIRILNHSQDVSRHIGWR